MNLQWKSLDAWSDTGLLIIRAGVGALFMCVHGFPRLMDGPDKWNSTGRALSYLDIDFGHTAFGLAATLTMTFGGALMIIGFAHRPVALALFVTMVVATIWKYYPFAGRSSGGDGGRVPRPAFYRTGQILARREKLNVSLEPRGHA
jgi:putative oxidoreductase